jgi:TfoX/Sxy family transcriptional regulator of competence genes
MATSVDYILYVCEQIRGVGEIRYKKMFGEYMIYVKDKPILLVCDHTVYVKQLDAIKAYMQEAEVGYPYQGAKEHYILDIEDPEHAKAVITILEEITPLPKPKKKKSKQNGTQKGDKKTAPSSDGLG